MLFGRLNQTRDLSHLSSELFRELSLLLIAPGLLQLIHLRSDPAGSLLHLLGESMQVGGELTELLGVDDGLTHVGLSNAGSELRMAGGMIFMALHETSLAILSAMSLLAMKKLREFLFGLLQVLPILCEGQCDS